MPSPQAVAFLIFDIESVADGALVAQLRYPGESLDAAAGGRAAIATELMAKYESDFIPYTFQCPISVAVAQGRRPTSGLLDVVVLDEPQFRPHVITRKFLARLGEVSPADAGQLQRPHVRPAALGAGRVSLRR